MLVVYKQFIPNIITSLALISGLIGLYFGLDFSITQYNLYIFSLCLCISMFFDGIDGKIARYLQIESVFGASLDNLADFFNFGIVPAIVIYFNYLKEYHFIAYLFVMFYIFCIFFRLARFTSNKTNNIHVSKSNKYLFTGVPSPIAASLLLTPVHINVLGFNPIQYNYVVFLATFIITGVLAISTLPTLAIGKLPLPENIILLAIIIIFIALYVYLLFLIPHLTLLITNTIYLFSLPFMYIYYDKILSWK